MSEEVNKRIEKLKGILGSSSSDLNFKYIAVYIIAIFIVYLIFQKNFVVAKTFLFIWIPIISVILIFFNKYSAAILATIIGFSSILRLQILPNLIDVTTGKYIPADPDALSFLRYVTEVVNTGTLPAVDVLRYFPQGYNNLAEFSFLAHIIASGYSVVHAFVSSLTIELAHVAYPAFSFIFILLFFYLLVKRLTNNKVALLSTAILSVIPVFLFRTLAGVSDKEAMGLVFMFAAIYFYVASWQSKNTKISIVHALLAGSLTGMLGLTWGGVSFLFILFAVFTLTQIIINKFGKRDFYTYAVWMIISIIILNQFYPSRFSLNTLLTSLTTLVMLGTFLFSLTHFMLVHLKLFGVYNRLKERFPPWVISGAVTFVLGIAVLTIIYGPNFILSRITETVTSLSRPFGGSRWAITVAESNQPFFSGGSFSWTNQIGNNYFIALFMAGVVAIFYNLTKSIGKYKTQSTALFALFLIGTVMSRYSEGSTFNGETTISQITYLGSLAGLFIMLAIVSFVLFRKDKELFEKMQNSNRELMFIIVWFILMAIAARSAIRLFIVFAPVISVTSAFFIVSVYEYLTKKIKEQKDTFYKGAMAIILIAFIMTIIWPVGSNVSAIPVIGNVPVISSDGILFKYAKISLNNARGTGSVYDQQWQRAGEWVRTNLPSNAVFAHWWDYGYLVQTGFERATLTDGGNAIGSRNYFSGRHLMTAQNETEALEYMKTYGATHLLFVVDEVGKYPAFSSIGSDVDYDRYSQISSFSLDTTQTQETRNSTILFYRGGAMIEDDITYNGEIYPAGVSGIGAVRLLISNDGSTIGVPIAVVVSQGKQAEIPLGCLYLGEKVYTFEEAPLQGCLRIVQSIQESQGVDPISSALYLSPRVRHSLFGRLYLLDEQIKGFNLVYKDERVPFAYYNGRLIGPIRIWEAEYSDKNIRTVPEYLKPELPDPRVNEVRRDFYESRAEG